MSDIGIRELRQNASTYLRRVEAGETIITDDQHLHFGKGQAVAKLELPPGEHVLRLQFANGAHIALAGPQYRDEITVMVAE